MAGQPEKDKKSIDAIKRWEQKEVRNSESYIVKALRYNNPFNTDDEEHF